MQQSNIYNEIQCIYSAVSNAISCLIPANACISAYSVEDDDNIITIGANILNTCEYLGNKIQNNIFNEDDYDCYVKMISYYRDNFISSYCK